MSLSSAISKAVQGLNMASRGTDLVSTNIANAQTAGYIRRNISVAELVVDGKSLGLQPTTVSRSYSAEASESVRRANITLGQQTVLTEAMQAIVDTIGDVNSDFSLSAKFDKFTATLKNLAETPENGALQDDVLAQAKSFATTINDVARSMQSIRENADSAIHREVQSVNETLERLKTVSGQIVTLQGTGDVSGLEDEQERLINKISQSLPISTTYNPNGSVRVATKTGITLLDINVTPLEFSPAADIPPNVIYAHAGTTVSAAYNPSLSGLTVGGLDVTPTADKIQSIDGGRLGGFFKVRDEYTVTTQKQIDSIAAGLIKTFRSQDTTIPDANLDGNPDGDSIFTFNTSGKVFTNLDDMLGVSNSFKVNAAVDPDRGGDKRRLRDGVGTTVFGAAGNATLIRNWISENNELTTFDATTNLTQNQSLMSAVREFVSLTSLKNQQEKNNFEYETGKMNTVTDIRDNAHGVNLDKEMNDLVYLQKLYSANAVLLQRAGDMLQTIIDIR